jgi:hypothetical protein
MKRSIVLSACVVLLTTVLSNPLIAQKANPGAKKGAGSAPQNLVLIPFKKDGKWGYCDLDKKVIIAPKYDDALPLTEGMAGVSLNDDWGFIDATGKEVVPLKYRSVVAFNHGLGGVTQRNAKGTNVGYVDKTGKQIGPMEPEYNFEYLDYGLYLERSDDKVGLYDIAGKNVVPAKFDACRATGENTFAVRINGKYGFIDKTGKELVPAKYDEVGNFSEGMASVMTGNKYGVVDKKGKELIHPSSYTNMTFFSNGYIAALRLNWVFMDKTGKLLTAQQYDDLKESPAYFFSEGFARICLNGKYGYINRQGKDLVYPKYSKASHFHNGMAKVEMDRHIGYIDTTGKEVLPTQYFFGTDFKKGIAIVSSTTGYGCIDKKGKVLIPMEYSVINPMASHIGVSGAEPADGYFVDGVIPAFKAEKGGLVDKSGKAVTPIKYTKMTACEGNIFCVSDEDHPIFYINSKGTEYLFD